VVLRCLPAARSALPRWGLSGLPCRPRSDMPRRLRCGMQRKVVTPGAVELFSAGGVQLLVAAAEASFWRGMWYMMDSCLFPGDPLRSGLTSLGVGWLTFGLVHCSASAAVGSGSAQTAALRTPMWRRCALVYGVSLALIAFWRGVWNLWDASYERLVGVAATEQALASGLASHAAGAAALFASVQCFSVLAPPTLVNVLRNAGIFTTPAARFFLALTQGIRAARRPLT